MGVARAGFAVFVATTLGAAAAGAQELPSERVPGVTLGRPRAEVLFGGGPAFAPGGIEGTSFGAGALSRFDAFGVGLWVEHSHFDVAYHDDGVSRDFIGGALRAFPFSSGRFDPAANLDFGFSFDDGCPGLGGQAGAGLHYFVVDFIKLGFSGAVAFSSAACAYPSSSGGGGGNASEWFTTKLEVAFAPARRRALPPSPAHYHP